MPRNHKISSLLARRGIDWDQVPYIVEVGSTAHGISTPDTDDDLDLTAIRFEAFEELILDPRRQSMMVRTQPEGERSHAGDIDIQVYTVRKFAKLAAKGNPSILAAIFSPHVVRLGRPLYLEDLGRRVASSHAGNAFLGYMRQQIERWIGIRGQKSVTRPELVEAYGFDTKYAAHVIRLGLQGIEYMDTGRFTMPMNDVDAKELVSLRTGGYTEYMALEWAKEVEDELHDAMVRSDLPQTPGTASANAWVLERYKEEMDQ